MATYPPLMTDTELDYPSSDGRPMAETPLRRDIVIMLLDIIRRWFANDQNVYVSGNMMLYYERANPRRWVSPDVQVTLGLPRDPERRVYKMWIEGKAPDLVIEVTSRTTQNQDEESKFELYRSLGVSEYFLFDPEGDYLDPPLQGYRRREGEYEPIGPVGKPLTSDVLKLQIARVGNTLRLYDPKTDRWLPQVGEALETAEEALSRAEEEVCRLRDELAALKKLTPPQNPEKPIR